MLSFIYPQGGQYYDVDGKLKQFKMWWPIVVAWYVDSFFRILVGKDPVPLKSTRTVVIRSGNTHNPKDQRISLVFLDHENPERQIWGTDLNASNARSIAEGLLMAAESVDPLYSKMSKEEILENFEKEREKEKAKEHKCES